MKKFLSRLWKDQEGQDLTEYALLLTFLSLIGASTITPLATTISGIFTSSNNQFST